jgi:GGDEF domain-containing protein
VVRTAELVRAGDLSARAEVDGTDEIAVMGRAFNNMAERLSAMVKAEQETREGLAERVNELDHINRLGELLHACFTLQEAYAVLERELRELFRGESGAVFACSASRNLIESVARWGANPQNSAGVFAMEECWALRSGRAHVVDDTRSGPLCTHLPSPPPGAYLCTPLVAQGDALGVLHVAFFARGRLAGAPLTEAKRRLADAVGEQVALGLANVKLREVLRSQSIRDPLTGLFNRRYMEETLEREVRRAQRAVRPMAVLMLDLDHFKRVNDEFGHDAGDALLRELGNLLLRNLRREDVACRYGGEEFVLVLRRPRWPTGSGGRKSCGTRSSGCACRTRAGCSVPSPRRSDGRLPRARPRGKPAPPRRRHRAVSRQARGPGSRGHRGLRRGSALVSDHLPAC